MRPLAHGSGRHDLAVTPQLKQCLLDGSLYDSAARQILKKPSTVRSINRGKSSSAARSNTKSPGSIFSKRIVGQLEAKSATTTTHPMRVQRRNLFTKDVFNRKTGCLNSFFYDSVGSRKFGAMKATHRRDFAGDQRTSIMNFIATVALLQKTPAAFISRS